MDLCIVRFVDPKNDFGVASRGFYDDAMNSPRSDDSVVLFELVKLRDLFGPIRLFRPHYHYVVKEANDQQRQKKHAARRSLGGLSEEADVPDQGKRNTGGVFEGECRHVELVASGQIKGKTSS